MSCLLADAKLCCEAAVVEEAPPHPDRRALRVQVIRPSGEVGKEITMGVFVRDIFLDQVRG